MNQFDEKYIQRIKDTAEQVWGKNCDFGETVFRDAPWCEFDWPAIIHGINVQFMYERGLLGLAVEVDGKQEYLERITQLELSDGFDSCSEEGMKNDFQVLDAVLKGMRE